MPDKKLAEFNFKVLHLILVCGLKLNRWGKVENKLCRICKYAHDILHLLFFCTKVIIIKSDLKRKSHAFHFRPKISRFWHFCCKTMKNTFENWTFNDQKCKYQHLKAKKFSKIEKTDFPERTHPFHKNCKSSLF